MVLVAKFPSRYLIYYLLGEGYSGVIVSLMSLITLVIGSDPEEYVLIYFGVGIVFTLLTITLLWYSENSNVYNYYVSNSLDNAHRGFTSFSDFMAVLKNIWPCIVIFNIMIVTLFSLHPSVTSLIVSENYGHGYVWNGKKHQHLNSIKNKSPDLFISRDKISCQMLCIIFDYLDVLCFIAIFF